MTDVDAVFTAIGQAIDLLKEGQRRLEELGQLPGYHVAAAIERLENAVADTGSSSPKHASSAGDQDTAWLGRG